MARERLANLLLMQAGQEYERRYELKRHGYDLDRIAEGVAEIYGMEPRHTLCMGRQQRKVKAGSLVPIPPSMDISGRIWLAY
ncbi:MAG: hypothetical protein K9N21_19560 [Deltaproteobacteria bacterium]|nr:hypothetical protein [Deltaproteobacteria bacterium]